MDTFGIFFCNCGLGFKYSNIFHISSCFGWLKESFDPPHHNIKDVSSLSEANLSKNVNLSKSPTLHAEVVSRKCVCSFSVLYFSLSGPYTGHSLGTPVLRKWRMRFYKGYIVIHLNRLELQTQAYTRSLIQHFWVFYLNVWELVDAFALKLWLNGRCCFASVLMLVWPPKPVYWRLKASRYATVSRGLWRVKSSVYNSLS